MVNEIIEMFQELKYSKYEIAELAGCSVTEVEVTVKHHVERWRKSKKKERPIRSFTEEEIVCAIRNPTSPNQEIIRTYNKLGCKGMPAFEDRIKSVMDLGIKLH